MEDVVIAMALNHIAAGLDQKIPPQTVEEETGPPMRMMRVHWMARRPAHPPPDDAQYLTLQHIRNGYL